MNLLNSTVDDVDLDVVTYIKIKHLHIWHF